MSKKILITGINGFIGSNAKKYFAESFEIFGLDIFGEAEKNFIQGEVDINNLEKFGVNFDYILHFAGSGTVSSAQKSPELEYAKSVVSLKNLLDYCVKNNRKTKIIFSSSAAVYGDKYGYPIKENDELNPISIYGKHKVEAEKLLQEYHEKYSIKSNIIRFFSIYGEGLRKQLLWDFSNRLKNNKSDTINCFGTGKEKRDFIHINDVLNFVELLINLDIDFDVFNCAAGKETCIDEILKMLCNEYNIHPEFNYDNIERDGDPKYLCANINKAKEIGFSPKINLQEGISQYAKWFKNC